MYKSMLHNIWNFFDVLEDRIRKWLSRHVFLYSFLGGISVVLFWRGVWHFADYVSDTYLTDILGVHFVWGEALISLGIASLILLATGLFVSHFIGNEIILSGLKGEKKLSEKTESEVKLEMETLEVLVQEMKHVSSRLQMIEVALLHEKKKEK